MRKNNIHSITGANRNDDDSSEPETEDFEAVYKGGDVTVPLNKFLAVRRNAHRTTARPPSNYVVESSDIKGRTNNSKRRVELTITFEIRTFGKESDWLTIPLIPASVAINSAQVSDGQASVETEAPSAFVAPSGDLVYLNCPGGDRCYRVKLTAHLPFNGIQLESFTLSQMPNSVHNKLEFVVEKGNIDVKVEPMVGLVECSEATVTPPGSADGPGYETTVRCCYPTSTSVTVQWREKVIEAKVDLADVALEQKKQTIVSAAQNVLHTINEGVVRSRVLYNLTVTHGMRTALEIDIHTAERKELRVLNVQGRAIKRWQLSDIQPAGPPTRGSLLGAPNDNSLAPYPGGDPDLDGFIEVDGEGVSQVAVGQPGAPRELQVAGAQLGEPVQTLRHRLTVYFEYGIEGDYQLVLSCETEMLASSAPVRLPCFAARAVDRETGHCAIEARTNVEINEISKSGVARIDVGELPGSITSGAENPILLGYKFLDTPYGLQLAVTKHDDAMSLVAVVEECWLQATQSDDAVLHRVVLRVRNSQKQFVRIAIPDRDHDIWSSVVNGTPVKAAIDHASGEVMIPLEKTTGGTKKPKPFLVELVYMVPSAKMEGRGTLDLSFAKVDIPIQQLYALVYVPDTCDYGEFEGDIKEAKGSIKAVPDSDAAAAVAPRPMVQIQRMDSAEHMCLNSDSGSGSDSDGDDGGFRAMQAMSNLLSNTRSVPAPKEKKAFADKGHIPVKIAKLEVGKTFKFEKLLVQSSFLKLSVPFKERPKESTRTLDDKPCIIM